MSTAFTNWLDARDGESIARAWSALKAAVPVEVVELREPGWWITTEGIARFAAAFLHWPVERLAWLTLGAIEAMPRPVLHVERETSRCFLEQALDDTSGCEILWIHEEREGTRGVQRLSAESTQSLDDDYRLNHATYGAIVHRVFDRATATGFSITGGSVTKIAKIGKVAFDRAAIDLYAPGRSFDLKSWTRADVADVRAFAAQLASAIGPGPYTFETRTLESTVFVDVRGLPWGYQLDLHVGVYSGHVSGGMSMRLPLAIGKAVLARLARVPGAVLK